MKSVDEDKYERVEGVTPLKNDTCDLCTFRDDGCDGAEDMDCLGGDYWIDK